MGLNNMKYWAFLPSSRSDSAILSAVPVDGPKSNKYRKGKSLKGSFPAIEEAIMCFDPNYPEGCVLQDIIECLDGVWVVSSKVKGFFESMGIQEEFLQVRLWDHNNTVVSDDYFIFNCLELVDFIDMNLSKVVFNKFFPDRVKRIKSLVINKGLSVDKKIFAPQNMTTQLFISDDLKEALKSSGFSGFKVFEAEGWDGMPV